MNPPMKGIAVAALSLLLGYSSSYLAEAKTGDSHTKLSFATDSRQRNYQFAIAQSIPLKNTLVIPGERVGPVTRNTTRKDLSKLFSESRLKDRTIYGPEGIGTFAATRVNLGSQQSFTVVWSDSTRTKPSDVRDFGSIWKTPQGIGVGTSFAELQKQLGEFKLYGLAWDYGGTILLEGTKLSGYREKLLLRVGTAPDAAKKFPQDYQAVMGDRTLSSTNPRWQRLGIRVEEMIVFLNRNN